MANIFGCVGQILLIIACSVIFVERDTSQLNLGLSEKDRERIKDTDLIFHSAASVRFIDNIRLIVNMNIRGTRDLLLLAQKMAFVYVSTAYSYCVYSKIEEKFYKPPIKTEVIIKLTEILKEDQLDLINPKQSVNTVQQYSNGISACIVRPSIVVATEKEPIVGWINNLYGITGIAVGSATGVLHTLYCNEKFICDIIPADYVVNNIIAAAWDVAQNQNDNVLKLWDKLSVVDKHKFFFNVSDIDWECFSSTYIKGVRVYLLKYPMETVDESRPFYRRGLVGDHLKVSGRCCEANKHADPFFVSFFPAASPCFERYWSSVVNARV
ncbi:fatty acyl-CoA reductase 1-like [Polistes fuscatus]|uniref:fatty acyl-CoA reductase 1-like n=1 Tax=Polistes fuscatus TaxID=30207 RepID=UPI001CA8619D|nr:fatty acyl-CoA reductase 1-like [Polistes fuscatus]